MIIECPECRARYHYSEERFEGKPSKKIRCAKCQQIFEIQNPALATPPPPPAADTDSTFVGRGRLAAAAVAAPGATDRAPIPTQLPSGKRLSLAILTGPSAGTVYRIEKPQVTIGRSNADVNVDDTEASRQHAVIEIHETTYRLVDLGSTNGTMVDGRKITAPVLLGDKSEFQIGGTILMLIVTDEQ